MIRIISQNGEVDINYAHYSIELGIKPNGELKRMICAHPEFTADYDSWLLGIYKNEERAREVIKNLRDNAAYLKDETGVVSYFTMPDE